MLLSDSRPFEVERYGGAWVRAGGSLAELEPVTPTTAAGILDGGLAADGVLLTGGPDVEPWRFGEPPLPGVELSPDSGRDALDLAVLARADAHGWPVLGICYGCQVLAVHRGGSLIQDLDAEGVAGHRVPEPKDFLAHTVKLVGPGRMAAALPEEFAVNSRHHQAVRFPGEGLAVTALAADGVVEAVEGVDPSRFVVGVQWHPENLSGGPHEQIFRLFRAACAEFAAGRRR